MFRMIIQFASEVTDFSSQYGSDNTISYTPCNVTGKPTVFPNYGDSSQAFAFRTYGFWWASTNLYSICREVLGKDFIELKLEIKVCPYNLKVYESYNPGGITKVLAYNEKSSRWIVLWNGVPQHIQPNARAFCPPIGATNFLTNIFRIEFSHLHLDYYCEVDAVEISGSLVEFKNYCQNLNIKAEERTVMVDSTNRSSVCILDLPGEVFNLILSYLNLESLCKASQVSKDFRNRCYDNVLYQKVNLQPYWHLINNTSLLGLHSRCRFVQELNLSWCGSQGHISPEVFVNFYSNCGKNITLLDMSNCPFLNLQCLQAVTQTSTYLTTLSLKNCIYHRCFSQGLYEISNLKLLQCLNLYRTHIDSSSLINIIQSCRNLEHLCLGGCCKVDNYDQICMEIGTNLSKLKTLDLWRAKTLTAIGIQYISSGCLDLEDLDIGWCDCIDTNSGCIQELALKCCKLKRIILSSIRTLSDADLLSLAYYCADLEQIDVLGTRDITQAAVEQFLCLTVKLKLLDISFSAQISPTNVKIWQSMFPGLHIKQSFKPFP